MIKNILSVIAVLIFALNYQIAEFIHPESIDWDANNFCRYNLYAVIIALFAYISTLEITKFSTMVLTIGIGFCLSDVLDRMLFNETHFKLIGDTIMILSTTIIAVYKYVRQGR